MFSVRCASCLNAYSSSRAASRRATRSEVSCGPRLELAVLPGRFRERCCPTICPRNGESTKPAQTESKANLLAEVVDRSLLANGQVSFLLGSLRSPNNQTSEAIQTKRRTRAKPHSLLRSQSGTPPGNRGRFRRSIFGLG